MSNFSTFSNQSLAGFVPALVIDYLLEKLRRKEVRKLPEKQTFASVVMFADISGFTNLAEKLSLKGPEGTELLAFTLNRYMELLVNGISRSGGDIFKFAGDAMIIVWPPSVDNSDEDLTVMCRQAIQSAMDIQSKLTDFKIIDEVKLSVKIGFGVGQVTIAHVGGVFQRAEYLPAGSPLTQAFECEHLAPGGGVVIVSKQTWERCSSFFEFEQINDLHGYKGENAPFFYCKKVKKAVKMKADAFLIKNKVKPGDLENIRGSLKSYIPAAVVPFIELDQEKWSAELRRLSVLFVNLGIDLKDTQTQPGLERIQQVIECVQRCVYSNQGSLNKFLMDDKGSTLMVVFGLYPMAHQDDPVRAVLTGMNLVSELRPIKCSCSVGITTGMVFAGVVGTSGNRREYSVLGDSVNLSARFMQAACQEKDKKVLVDEATKLEAEHKLRFRFVKKSTVKGKSGEISFFEPVEEELVGENRNSSETKVSSSITIDQRIKIHVVDGWDNRRMMLGKGYESQAMKGMGLLDRFLNKPVKNGLVLITGSYGAGKSLLVTDIVNKVASKIETTTWKYNDKVQIYANSLNSVEKARKMNGWRRILQEILTRLSLRLKQNCESVLLRLLDKNEELIDNLYLVSDILSLKFKPNTASNKNKYIQRAQDIYERKLIKKILIKILLKYLEEDEDEEEDKNDVSIEENMQKSASIMMSQDIPAHRSQDIPAHRSQDSNPRKKNDISNTTPVPLVIILDDMQDYDVLSWDFTFKALRKLKKVFIFACVRSKFIELPPVFKKPEPTKPQNENPQAHSSHRKTLNGIKPGFSEPSNQEELVESGIIEFEEICENSLFLRLELKGLEKTEIEVLMLKFLGVKRIEFENMLNSGSSLERFFGFMMEKTEGTPLDIFHLTEKIRSSGYGEVLEEKKTFVLKKNLLKMIEISEFLTLETPLCRLKVNGPIIDRLSAPQMLLMKAAAVIGEVFDLQTLLKVNPFKSSMPNEKVRGLINELERQDFIEILDDQNNNIQYRFTSPFMREVIYQRVTYNQRRTLHRYVAEAIQAIPMSLNPGEERLECDRLIYHWCLAENKDPFSHNSLMDPSVEFSNKAKRSIIVKKISSILAKNPNNLNTVIKQGDLDKKSDRGFKWSKRYCLMNPREFKYYYTEEDSNRDASIDQPLGTIPFKNIFQIMPLKETESKGKPFAFVIYVGSWQKKDKEMGIREFYFSAYSNDELEQWTTYMEFIRAKAIYDSFVNTFGKISFPLTNNALEKLESMDENAKGMSKMALMTQKEHGTHQSIVNTYKSHNSSMRKTTFKTMNLKDRSRKDNTFNESSSTETAISNYNAECHKKLKERLNHFFQSSLFLFWSHVFESSSRNSSKIDKKEADFMFLGNNTGFMKEKNHHFFFERTLFDDVMPPQNLLLDKRISKYHTSFSINGRSSNASVLYNSVDSMDEFNNNSPKIDRLSPNTSLLNNNSNNSQIKEVKHTGIGILRPLDNIDENVDSEDLTSPQTIYKKSFSLKTEEKTVNSLKIRSEGDLNTNSVTKRNQFLDDSKLDSLEKIEEVNETRDSLINSDKNLQILREKMSIKAEENEKERQSYGQKNIKQRKSRFLKLQPASANVDNNSIKEIIAQRDQKEEKEIEENNPGIESLRNMPILSAKIGHNMHKYVDQIHGIMKPEYEEIVVTTKKGDVVGRNENYGEIWKKLTKNEAQILEQDSLRIEEEDDESSMKDIIRQSVERITRQELDESEEEFHNNNNNNKGKRSGIVRSKQKNSLKPEKAESSLEKLEKWEAENGLTPNDELLNNHRVETFSEKDLKFLSFPRTLSSNQTKESNYFQRDSLEFEETQKQNEGEEVLVKKKKMKDYSQYNSRKKSDISDEDRVFFKDYETLCRSGKWGSNRSNHGKQEGVINLNYKTVKNFQSKNS